MFDRVKELKQSMSDGSAAAFSVVFLLLEQPFALDTALRMWARLLFLLLRSLLFCQCLYELFVRGLAFRRKKKPQ